MENNDYVQLQFVEPQFQVLNPRRYVKKSNADELFRKIQTQREKYKETKSQINKSQNIYDKITYTLQKKLGCISKTRVSSTNQEIRIKGLIEMCKQQKHVRKRNFSDKPNNNQQSRIMKSRPQSSRTNRTFSPKQTSMKEKGHRRIYSAATKNHKDQVKNRQEQIRQDTKTIDSNHVKEFSAKQIIYEKQNQRSSNIRKGGLKKFPKRSLAKKEQKVQINEKQSNKINSFKNIQLEIEDYNEQKSSTREIESGENYQRTNRKKIKNPIAYRLNIEKNLKNILKSCENTKKQINAINKKVGFFEYYSMRMSKNLQKVKNVLPKKNQLHDLYE